MTSWDMVTALHQNPPHPHPSPSIHFLRYAASEHILKRNKRDLYDKTSLKLSDCFVMRMKKAG